MNPFLPLYERCNAGSPEDKLLKLGTGPIIIDLEPVGACNFRCAMCPTGLGMLGRPSGFMSMETYQAILDKFPGAALRFIGWGEPTMHPKLIEMIAQARKRMALTHVNTNGSLLTPDMTEELIEAGLDSIKFSFQGVTRETYLRMRRADFFENLMNVIKYFRDERDQVRGQKFDSAKSPWIAASTTVTDEPEDDILAFVNRMSGLVDHLSIGRTTFAFIDKEQIPPSRAKSFAEAFQNKELRHPVPCPEVFDKLTVHWDGSVRVCCNDYSGVTNLGNVNTDTAEAIWSHHTMEAYRARLARKQYEGPLCATCDNYMDLG